MSAKRGLGRGLGALITDEPVDRRPAPQPETVRTVPIGELHANPMQPRQRFDPEALEELVRSVKEHGVVQPLLVRRTEAGYELIAGERRLRAAKDAGLLEVPVVVSQANDREALELALVENLQREDLNPVEEAEGYQALAERFALTQEQIAEQVGKARATVANALRLLALPEDVRLLLADGKLQPGHGKVLLQLDIPEEQAQLAARILKEDLSVRELEKLVARARRAPKSAKPRALASDLPPSYLSHLSDILHRHFGTSVYLTPSKTLANGKKVKGTIQIDFFSNEELDRLLSVLGVTDQI